MSYAPPPLPPGWTEHVAPGGQPYYYNNATQESTYVRPLPAFLTAAPPQPGNVAPAAKEKPLAKTPIPGTEWLRVRTTAGNVFYTHKGKKQSVWTVPEEIRNAVALLEKQEKDAEQNATTPAQSVKLAPNKRKKTPEDIAAESIDEVVVTKKPRVGEDERDAEGWRTVSVAEQAASPSASSDEEDEEEEEWQREAAEQLAAEAEEERKIAEEEAQREAEAAKAREEEQEQLKKREKEKGLMAINMPSRVDLSLDEAKALFKTLLREKDINPMMPWDSALPSFISDPRYVLLPSVAARKDAFDEYCRDRARELRAAKVSQEKSSATHDGVTAESEKDKAKDDFDKLLKDEVTSTRTSWTDFRRTWRKDRRFFGWGRDDREREKHFKAWLKELGEEKRKKAQKAERDFFALLKSKGKVNPESTWKDVKRSLDRDPRYDAVGSSSLREELFGTYLKTIKSSDLSSPALNDRDDPEPHKDDDSEAARKTREKERKERAVREREEKVRAEKGHLEAEMARSRMGLSREEGERDFRTMLTDAIRDPTATWNSSLTSFKTDPRFVNSPLPINMQTALFNAHVRQLQQKHVTALHALFASYAPSLATPLSSLPLESILASLPAAKLGFADSAPGEDGLRAEYERWQRERTTQARAEFDEMLGENAFVEFWGKLRKMGGEGKDGKVKVDDEDLIGEEGGDGQADLKKLAQSIDVREVERVLKNDKRYVMFDHVPDQRERWVRDYLSNLSAPKLSVHQPPSTS